MDPLVLIIGIFSLVVLGILAAGLASPAQPAGAVQKEASTGTTGPEGKPCPLCGARLQRGERVHSVVFKKSAEDQSMEIFGCPYCWKDHPSGGGKHRYARTCPVCRKELDTSEPVFARVFRRQDRSHVHVLGCRRCRAHNRS